MWYPRRKKNEGEDAKRALEDAHANLRRIKARSPEVSTVATNLRVLRERNHFVEQLQVIMEGPK